MAARHKYTRQARIVVTTTGVTTIAVVIIIASHSGDKDTNNDEHVKNLA